MPGQTNLLDQCKVLQCIALYEPCDCYKVLEHVPDLSLEQIQKAIYRLIEKDKVRKFDRSGRSKTSGKQLFRYRINDYAEQLTADEIHRIPATNAVSEKKTERKNRPTHTENVRTKSAHTIISGRVKYRDRKIRVLKKCLNIVDEKDRNYIIGILSDYGVKVGDPVYDIAS